VRRLLRSLALLTFASRAATAQSLAPAAPDPRAPLLVTAEWLSQHLRDPNLVLLHVGTAADYPAAHIPGARLVSVADVAVSDTARKLNVEMPGAEPLRARLAALGVSDRSRVVVYFASDMVYQTTRILFTLFYAGLGERAALLDGGMGAWTAAGLATSTEIPAAVTGTLSPLSLRNFVVDAAYVQSMIGKAGVSIVDARDSVFYTGARQGGSAQAPHRPGHVPSARSVPWTLLYDATLQLKPREELARIFAAAGVKPGDVVIGYCHTGQQATAMLLAARSLGHAVLLYDGSYQDWSARGELPVETNPPL
jgi:thiosulfate/3-mercaptopyruvate sulfurtransferase